MGKGTSKAGGGSGGGKANEQEKFVNEMVEAMTRQYTREETPFSNSDLEGAVEAYAMTHKGVDENALLNTIRGKVDTVQKTAKLEKFSNNAFKATYASDIKPGDEITDKIINESTGNTAHKMWTFHPEGYDTFQGYPYDVTVTSVKVSGKTTKVTAVFDKAMIKRNPQPSDWGKDLMTVTKTFKNNDILQKRKKGGK